MRNNLRIILVSLHGLLRRKNLEIGKDADNGGQIVYVMQLARALSEMPASGNLASRH